MKLRTLLVALLSITALLAGLHAQQPSVHTQVEALLDAHEAHARFSGVVLIADGGEVIFEKAVGLANDDWQIANQLDTKFRIGAMTMQFTAMLVLLLVEDGVLELDAPIGRYLSGLPPETGAKVTVHHLLSHTSGIPRYRGETGWRDRLLHHRTVADYIGDFCSRPLDFEPGTEFRYGLAGYYLLGGIIGSVTGKPYRDVLRERILDPLEMHDTGCEGHREVVVKRATGYDDVAGARRVARWVDMSNFVASEGLYSTVGDLWKWDQALRAERLLRGKLAEWMFTPRDARFGYGWHIDDHGIWHGGGIFGFSTMIGRVPSLGRCAIVLSNSGFASASEVAQGIEAILQGRAATLPTPHRAWDFAESVLANGVEESLKAFAALPEPIRNREVETTIHVLGHRLLKQDRAAEAIVLFEFSTQVFTASSNWWKRWESLGEAHLAADHLADAEKAFLKAVELDPRSDRSKKALERLRSGKR